jgi:hypothetical protein
MIKQGVISEENTKCAYCGDPVKDPQPNSINTCGKPKCDALGETDVRIFNALTNMTGAGKKSA